MVKYNTTRVLPFLYEQNGVSAAIVVALVEAMTAVMIAATIV